LEDLKIIPAADQVQEINLFVRESERAACKSKKACAVCDTSGPCRDAATPHDRPGR